MVGDINSLCFSSQSSCLDCLWVMTTGQATAHGALGQCSRAELPHTALPPSAKELLWDTGDLHEASRGYSCVRHQGEKKREMSVYLHLEC